MPSLPLVIHTAAQVRALDRYAIDTLGIPGYELMSRAGAAAFDVLRERWPNASSISVLCGPGNNGGDGFVVARLARERGLRVRAIALTDAAQLQGDAARAFHDFRAAGGQIAAWSEDALEADVIVDAMFGTGLSRELDASSSAVAQAIAAASKPVLALDIPSGLHADSGAVLGAAVRADCTITFIGLKAGFYLGSGPDYVGDIRFADLGLDETARAQAPTLASRIDERELRRALPRRPRTAHKGQHGNVLIVGGGVGMAGAARLAGEAVLRCGAGRVTVATHPDNVAAIVGARPELMCHGVRDEAELRALIERADVLAIGPGLGQSDWSRAMMAAVVRSDRPAVIDADALNLLAGLVIDPQQAVRWILTPHPGEAGRLLGLTNAQIQQDRLRAASEIAARYRAVVVLKGAGSIVAAPGAMPGICDRGNPGMASPGMGDVLTGVIAGLLGQLRDLALAARMGVLVHALAGDRVAERQGERGMIASDLFELLPSCVNPNRSY
jgi:hydroxyethylthiazole kinase-like uncharacterized protein yjeF